MSAIHIRKKLDSDTLQLAELKPLVGKTVEITIEEASPAPPAADWEEIDRLVEENARLFPGPDVGVDIIREMRESRHLERDE